MDEKLWDLVTEKTYKIKTCHCGNEFTLNPSGKNWINNMYKGDKFSMGMFFCDKCGLLYCVNEETIKEMTK